MLLTTLMQRYRGSVIFFSPLKGEKNIWRNNKTKGNLFSAPLRVNFLALWSQKERISQRNNKNDDNCVSSVEERKMNYFMASGWFGKVGLQEILERNFISEWCMILSPCPRHQAKRIYLLQNRGRYPHNSFFFLSQTFSISMDSQIYHLYNQTHEHFQLRKLIFHTLLESLSLSRHSILSAHGLSE